MIQRQPLDVERPRFLLQAGPDDPVAPCGCGCPFAKIEVIDGRMTLWCEKCHAKLNDSILRFYEVAADEKRAQNHRFGAWKCSTLQRVLIPRVRDEVDAATAIRLGAERWDAYCVSCGHKDGGIQKDVLRGASTVKRRDYNAFQRVDVLERAGMRCDLCCKSGVALDVGHCLSCDDGKAIGAKKDIVESIWNKCALCLECNQAAYGGYGARSMSPSTYCKLAHTRPEADKMLNFGPKGPTAIEPEFYAIYCLLRQCLIAREGTAA